MNSYFITGTDTDVGKTIITAGFARIFVNKGKNVGVMKPFAAGEAQSTGFVSKDSEFIANAARVSDPEELITPQFFPIPASPYTASMNLDMKVDLKLVINCFEELRKKHDVMLVEGMGGIMTPILQDYSVANLISDFNLEAIIVCRTRIGTVNHTLMTAEICKKYNIPIKGIIINHFDKDGYEPTELKRDLENLLGLKVLGVIPQIGDLSIDSIAKTIESKIDFDLL